MAEERKPGKRVFSKMTDRFLQAIIDYAVDEGERPLLWDRRCHGLRLQVGRVRHSWSFYVERRFRGKRQYYFRRLGFFPTMNVAAARKAALAHAAKVSETHFDPGTKQAMRLDTALASYIEYLRDHKTLKAARNAKSLAKLYLLPEFGSLTLRELSDSPAMVEEWHKRISKHSTAMGNNAARLLRACYRRAARLDRSLPAALPTSAVTYNREEPAQTAMPFSEFPKWRRAVETLPPIRQGYHKLMLLTGMRGESARRLQWSDINLKARTFTLRGAPGRKIQEDISLPMTSAIIAALKLARPMRDGVIFPGAVKWKDRLPYQGHALRHSWASVAADLGIDELQRRLLLGHSLRGISQAYVTRAVVSGAPGLRAAQRRVSRRIVELLGRSF